MNASDYRSYREEREYNRALNMPKEQDTIAYTPVSNICNTDTPKNKKSPIKGKYRAILQGYQKLNDDLQELKEYVDGLCTQKITVTYGQPSIKSNKRHDLSDIVIQREKHIERFTTLTITQMKIVDMLYSDAVFYTYTKGIDDRQYIIDCLIYGNVEEQKAQTARIIERLIRNNIELPTVTEVKRRINENVIDDI